MCMDYIWDIETDGIDATKIHCVVLYCLDNNEWYKFYEYDYIRGFFNRLTGQDTLIGHNIIRYDIPVLERLLDVKIRAKVLDTLALSWYLEPNRIKHGLESYGTDFGVPKPKITDWENLSIEDYMHRCTEDVKINTQLWVEQDMDLDELYDGNYDGIVNYLMFKMKCAAEQEAVKWKLDFNGAKKLLTELSNKRDTKISELKLSMPKIPKYVTRNKPKVMYKKDGELSKKGRDWIKLLNNSGGGHYFGENICSKEIQILTGYSDPNPGSVQQIKDWLYSLGWVPETFNYVKDPKIKSGRKVAQIKLNGELCPSIIRLIDKNPSLRALEGLSILTHRIGIVKGFLENVDNDRCLKASISGFTNTLRYKHKVLVNIPGNDKPYGSEIRGLLIAEKGYLLCGSDMSSLEDNTKQNYMMPYDPDYVQEMQDPDYDPHLSLALHAGALNEQQIQDHKSGVKDYSDIRRLYKTTNYAAIYGAGGAKLALTLGISKKEGEALKKAYWAKNWSVKEIPKDIEVKECLGSKWLKNPVSGFWYSLRYEKDIFSTLNQGTGVFCFDVWVKYVRSKGVKITASYHDEIIVKLLKGREKDLTDILQWAIGMTNKQLKLNKALSISIDFGKSYADIH